MYTYILYIIAFLEGFTTLSVEIMVIRNSLSIIGSNAIATSTILGIILLALSYGYYRGGIYAARHDRSHIEKKIYINLLIASLFYTCVSFPFENPLLSYLLEFDIGYFIAIFLGISILFILPVFLASQTIPLISELVDDGEKAIVIGKLLFFSTIGSFLGSVMTSLVFFSFLGVEKSIILNGIILAVLALIMLMRMPGEKIPEGIRILHISYLLFLVYLLWSDYPSGRIIKDRVYAQSTEYNDIAIYESAGRREFRMNGSLSSGIDIETGESYFGYNKKFREIIEQERPKHILIIGAAGFSLPQNIAGLEYIEKIDVCDIDGSLKTIAEEHFLREKLHPKIQFYPQSARYFIYEQARAGIQYDMIILDAYNGRISIPSELLTEEFFQSVTRLSSGTILMNVIMDTTRTSDFSQNLARTIKSVFPTVSITPMNGTGAGYFDNFVVATGVREGFDMLLSEPTASIYRDDQHTLEIDKYRLFYTQKYN